MSPHGPTGARASRSRGFTTVLVIVYGIFAISATARSLVQVLRDFDAAPLAYSLSLLAAITYIAVTVALVRGRDGSRAALWLVVLELVGVVCVGTVSVLAPSLFPDDTVWSVYGIGYGFIPLLLPVAALTYLMRQRSR
ncbi:hypothetical protein [Brachybacterium epidermidis]|uniref:hypothetical protein n=1 Tax=Brachybacterium epidermidis TaxID=2781983 RepID=UPI00398F72DB